MKRKDKSYDDNNSQFNSILEGTKIIGDIVASSAFRINGEVVGNIISQSKIIIGKNGIVCGNINCSEAEIEGILEGKIEVNNLLVLRENSKVVGDILTSKLHIEEGAIFLGDCRMSGHTSLNSTSHQLISTEDILEE